MTIVETDLSLHRVPVFGVPAADCRPEMAFYNDQKLLAVDALCHRPRYADVLELRSRF
jgi:hypothetical protein